jgi:uncharacterized DUF497 family protein
MHEAFEWDPEKAEANAEKHGVSFELAAEVLADPFAERFHIDEPQPIGGEDRWKTLASHPRRRHLVFCIVWTERGPEEEPVTRIISARRATRQERERYEQGIF